MHKSYVALVSNFWRTSIHSIERVYDVLCGSRVVVGDLRFSYVKTEWAIYPSGLFLKPIERCDIFWILDCININSGAAQWSRLNALLGVVVPDSMQFRQSRVRIPWPSRLIVLQRTYG